MLNTLFIHIDPDYDHRDPACVARCERLRNEANRRGVRLWSFTGRDVPENVARRQHLERLFYRSSLPEKADSPTGTQTLYSPARLRAKMVVKQVLDPLREFARKHDLRLPVSYPAELEPEHLISDIHEQDHLRFAGTFGMILRRAIAHGYGDVPVSIAVISDDIALLPVLVRLLRRHDLSRMHLAVIFLCTGDLIETVPAEAKRLTSYGMLLELIDPERRISLCASSPQTAGTMRRFFSRPVQDADSQTYAEVFFTAKPVESITASMKADLADRQRGPGGSPADAACEESAMRRFHNIHRGQRCFIAGNGPSLNRMNLNALDGEYLFCSNAIFLLFPRVNWRPQYYTAVDTRVVPDRAADIIAMHEQNPDMILFLPRQLTNHQTGEVTDTATIIPPGRNRIFFEQKYPDESDLPFSAFSLDAGRHLVQPYTVTVTALQLAVYMGFDPIYLIGCDTEYVVPDTVQREGTVDGKRRIFFTSTKDDDVNHFAPEYFGKGRKWHHPQVEMMVWHYRMAHEAAAIQGTRIFNATAGGKLEVFPRVDFDGLFR